MNYNGMQNNIMPMNFQPNLMANPFQNNPIIIQQYENTIMELNGTIKQLNNKISQYEKLIIQKDLEIYSLKNKINNNIMSGLMMMMQNMNQQFNNSNNNNNNINMNNKPLFINNNININQNDTNNKIKIMIESHIKMSNLKKTEQAFSLLDIFKNLHLTLNYKPLILFQTIEENGIYDGAIINISNNIYNLHFNGDNDQDWIIDLDEFCPFKQAIIYFCEKTGIKNIYQKVLEKKVWFEYNAKKYMEKILDETPFKNVFGNTYNPTIRVML